MRNAGVQHVIVKPAADIVDRQDGRLVRVIFLHKPDGELPISEIKKMTAQNGRDRRKPGWSKHERKSTCRAIRLAIRSTGGRFRKVIGDSSSPRWTDRNVLIDEVAGSENNRSAGRLYRNLCRHRCHGVARSLKPGGEAAAPDLSGLTVTSRRSGESAANVTLQSRFDHGSVPPVREWCRR